MSKAATENHAKYHNKKNYVICSYYNFFFKYKVYLYNI